MKKIVLSLALLLPCSVMMAAKPKPNPADYTVTVHVISSASVSGGSGTNAYSCQSLETVIDGKPVQLLSAVARYGVLALGDYPAKISSIIHPPKKNANTYDIYRGYEFLMPDGTTRTYEVTRLGPAVGTQGVR